MNVFNSNKNDLLNFFPHFNAILIMTDHASGQFEEINVMPS